MKKLTLILLGSLVFGYANAGVLDRAPKIKPSSIKIVGAAHKQVNLKVLSFKLDREICAGGCNAALKDLGIKNLGCDIILKVKNTGGAPAPAHTTRISYVDWKGKQKTIDQYFGPIKPGGVAVISFRSSLIGWYEANKPFMVKLDLYNQVKESNELDNTYSRKM